MLLHNRLIDEGEEEPDESPDVRAERLAEEDQLDVDQAYEPGAWGAERTAGQSVRLDKARKMAEDGGM